ncbi:TetR/AcrR family transcriptional regulator [Pseudenhygromyxa sp. WMMC2535]|uniref:TetR/AcrR family transcriptional regulator n=1 Tax=Pseudenhygromyxa sp. WMMC2535 TaxID=2712867 RepID=UPI001C3E3D0E|nr:TetR/AcrR family transcriptional regulator [Pseudenhygromyxa sp. WMMC2535]
MAGALKARKQPRQRRSRALVAAIIEGAARVFDREGFAATTNRIASEAGVSIGSLYQYFPNKESLLLALAERHLEQGQRQLEAAVARAREAEEVEALFRCFVEAIVDAHRRHPRMHQVLEEVSPRTPELIARARELKRIMQRELAAQLRRLRPELDQVERKAALLTSAIPAAIHDDIGERRDAAMVDELVALCIRYLGEP